MSRTVVSVLAGIALIVFGVVFLLDSVGVLQVSGAVWPALFFGLGGLAFVGVFLNKRDNWWAVIPGLVLLGIAGVIAWGELAPAGMEEWGGGIFLGCISLAFWIVYLTNREFWWALIPAGVLLTLAVVAGLGSVDNGSLVGGIFFLGLALTFGLLSFVKTPEGRLKWALIPAAVLLVMGVVITASAAQLFGYIWPAALILVGIYLLVRFAVARPQD